MATFYSRHTDKLFGLLLLYTLSFNNACVWYALSSCMYLLYNLKIKHFSVPSSVEHSEPETKGKDTAIREACESDLFSYFRTNNGMNFKNEFCALCNFPYIPLNSWRNCEEQPESAHSDSLFDMTMMLTLIDTLPSPVSDNRERMACTSSYAVSIFDLYTHSA